MTVGATALGGVGANGRVAMDRKRAAVASLLCSLAVTVAVAREMPQAGTAAVSAKTWTDRVQEIEEYLKTAEIVQIDEIGVGVTKPRRARLAPGGPAEAIAWKAIRPGRYNGFYESYKSEIAAYELDKLLGLGMIPPTVEKRVKGELGAAVLWASPTRSFKDLGGVPGQQGVKGPPPAEIPRWMRQLTRAKMFDNLIGNIDPNLGNWLVDPGWNLILIDHTRSFTTSKELYHQLSSIDVELWNKMKALDEPSLTSALGNWLDARAIKGILERRDKMQPIADKLRAGSQD
jgi:hypothetical protein